MRKVLTPVFLVGCLTTLCSAATIYGYTGEDVTGGRDSQFVITATTVHNNDTDSGTLEDSGALPNDSFILTAASVSADTYATLNVPAGAGGGTASWVGPQANQDTGTSGGPINGSACCKGATTYTVTFNLTGFNLSDAVTLELMLAGDDTVSATLNGHALSVGTPTYNTITTTSGLNVTSDTLSATLNTLVLVVNNSGGGPTGLDAFYEFTGTSLATPEPLTFALTGLGVLGLGVFARRRKA